MRICFGVDSIWGRRILICTFALAVGFLIASASGGESAAQEKEKTDKKKPTAADKLIEKLKKDNRHLDDKLERIKEDLDELKTEIGKRISKHDGQVKSLEHFLKELDDPNLDAGFKKDLEAYIQQKYSDAKQKLYDDAVELLKKAGEKHHQKKTSPGAELPRIIEQPAVEATATQPGPAGHTVLKARVPVRIEQKHLDAAKAQVQALREGAHGGDFDRNAVTLARHLQFPGSLAGTRPPRDLLAHARRVNSRLLRRPVHKTLAGAQLPQNYSLFDHVDQAKFPIQDQGACGCCWIFGAVAAYEANYLKVLSSKANAAEQHILNCVLTDLSNGCNGGWPSDAFEQLVKGVNEHAAGTANRNQMPYQAAPAECESDARLDFKAVEFGYLDANQEIPDRDEIKQAIYTYGAVVCGVYAGDEFMSYNGGGDFRLNNNYQINHAVSLVGWKTKGSDTYWLLRNSWGTVWGANGYMWIREKSNNVGFGAMWVTASSTPAPTPNGTPPNVNSVIQERIDFWSKTKYGLPK